MWCESAAWPDCGCGVKVLHDLIVGVVCISIFPARSIRLVSDDRKGKIRSHREWLCHEVHICTNTPRKDFNFECRAWLAKETGTSIKAPLPTPLRVGVCVCVCVCWLESGCPTVDLGY